MNGFPFVFANPWGALALLGVPAVIAIHCLQQKSRVLSISTLFLLERMPPDSKEGRRISWLRSSIPFWLQIFCVLILTWVLLEPRWLASNAVQRVVLVLDSSISMRAFKNDLVSGTSSRLRSIASLAPRTYWTLVETDLSRPTLYEGLDYSSLVEKLGAWNPSLPAHDPSRALELARSLAPPDALVVFVTDRPHDVPSGVDLLAIGEPLENCGLVGTRMTGTGPDLEWSVVAQNYGSKVAHRSWWIEFAGRATDRQSFDLEPGHPKVLKGRFPRGVDRIDICLEPDRFTLDDRMTLVRPEPKLLTVQLLGDDATTDLFARLAQTLPALALVQANQTADLAFISSNPSTVFPGDAVSSVQLFNDPSPKAALVGGPFVAEDDALNQDLNWQALIVQPETSLAVEPPDHVLLWKSRQPLIFVRSGGGGHRQLIFNFNLTTSNATRLPAFVLLIDRFVESIRRDKLAPEVRNAELNESLTIAADPHGAAVVLRDADGATNTTPARALVTMNAPSEPGPFQVTQGSTTLLSGAAQFADARDSDFTTAATIDTLSGRRARLVEMHSQAEAITPLWLLLIGALLIVYWRAASPRDL